MKKEFGVYKIIGSFLVFMIIFIANLNIPVSNNVNHTSRMWLITDLCIAVLSIFLIIKNKLPDKKHIIISFLLGVLMFVSYKGFNFSSINTFINTTLCTLASFSIFSRYPVFKIVTLKNKNVKSVLFTLFIGIFVGVVLGIANLFFAGKTLHFDFNLTCFLTSLSPAIFEEVSFRLILFAYCLFLLNGKIQNKSENFLCYFMMIIPHVLLHTPDVFLSYGVIPGIINSLLLSLFFGLPFAILQRKRDLTSAMIAHGLVDLIRFSFLGLPF